MSVTHFWGELWQSCIMLTVLFWWAAADIRRLYKASVELHCWYKPSVLYLIAWKAARGDRCALALRMRKGFKNISEPEVKEVQVCCDLLRDPSTRRAAHTPRPYLDYHREPPFATRTIVNKPCWRSSAAASRGRDGTGNVCVRLCWRPKLVQISAGSLSVGAAVTEGLEWPSSASQQQSQLNFIHS